MPHGDDRWIQTVSGKRFWPLDPKAEDIHIADIAHALSLMCRFGGHCTQFYSVAEHSVRVARIISALGRKELTLTALLHDAAEAYMADVLRPIKKHIVGLVEVEHKLEQVIADKFNLIYPFPDCIKSADYIMLATEKRDLMHEPQEPWDNYGAEPLKEIIEPMHPNTAVNVFLDWYMSNKIG